MQQGSNFPDPDDPLNFRSPSSSTSTSYLLGSRLLMFRNGRTTIMHIHMPMNVDITWNYLEKLFYTIFSELRQLRCSHNFEITADYSQHGLETLDKTNTLVNIIKSARSKIKPFLPPADFPDHNCPHKAEYLSEVSVNLIDPPGGLWVS